MITLCDIDKETRAFRTTNHSTDQVSIEHLESLGTDESRYHMVAMTQRPGITKFITSIELLVFHSELDRINELDVLVVMWERLPFWVLSVPMHRWLEISPYMRACRLVCEWGVPSVHKDGEVSVFPMSGPTVATLVNHHAHPIHKLTSDESRLALAASMEAEDRRWCASLKEAVLLTPSPPLDSLVS